MDAFLLFLRLSRRGYFVLVVVVVAVQVGSIACRVILAR